MAWLAIAITCSICFIQVLRWTQQVQGCVPLVGWVNYVLAASYFGARLVMQWPAGGDWLVAVLGLLTGILYVNNYYLTNAAIRRIGLGLSAATMALSVTVPVGVSVAFGDPWRDKALGLFVALVALPMIAVARRDQDRPKNSVEGVARVLWVIGFFLAVGMEGTFFKVAREVGGRGFEGLFLPGLFGAAAVASTVPAFLAHPKFRAGDVLRGVIQGLCNILGNYALTQAVLVLSGPVVFPVRYSALVTGTALLGRVLWRERLSRMALAGIALTLMATVLLAWSDLIASAGL